MRTKTVVGVVLLLAACAGLCPAAEKIREDEITKRIAPVGKGLGPRKFTIVTVDGRRYRGSSIEMDSEAVRIWQRDSWESIRFTQLGRLEISQCGRFWIKIVDAAALPLAGAAWTCSVFGESYVAFGCFGVLSVAFSPGLGYAAAVAPVYLIADGVGCILPPKVYEIVH
jgi:hypothetical protein